MRVDALGQNGWIVTALEDANDPAAGVNSRHIAHDFSQRGKVFGLQSEGANWIEGVTIESGADEYKLWPDVSGKLLKLGCERVTIRLPRCAERDWQVNRRPESGSGAGFITIAGARIERPAVN